MSGRHLTGCSPGLRLKTTKKTLGAILQGNLLRLKKEGRGGLKTTEHRGPHKKINVAL